MSRASAEQDAKINGDHLARMAYVYVRQSSPRQVQEHLESRRRQYALVDWALERGWSREAIVVIDEDQGKSSATARTRTGFARLLAATAYGPDADPDLIHPPPVAAAPPPSPPAAAAPSNPSPAHYLWARLLARLFASLPLVCPNCGADMRIRAFVAEAAPVRRILLALGEPAEPPRIRPARPGATLSCSAWVPAQTVPGLGVRCSTAAHPPAWDDPPVEAVPDWDALAQPQPEYIFNQEVQW